MEFLQAGLLCIANYMVYLLQAKVEFTTIAQLYLGKNYHLALQVLLYFAMQSVNIASIVISIQVIIHVILSYEHKSIV